MFDADGEGEVDTVELGKVLSSSHLLLRENYITTGDGIVGDGVYRG